MLQLRIFIYFSVGLVFGILDLKSIGLFKFARWLNVERLLLIGCSITTLLWLPFMIMGIVIDISNEELD